MSSKARHWFAVGAAALLASCNERIEPPELKPDDAFDGWLYAAAQEVHSQNLRPESGLHHARYHMIKISVRDHHCAWIFYDEPNMSYTGGDFIYCFDPETQKFAFRLR